MPSCSFISCKNSSARSAKKVRYHQFPSDKNIIGLWMEKCKRGGQTNPQNARICSDHFDEDSYIDDPRLPSGKRLKKDAIPRLQFRESRLPDRDEIGDSMDSDDQDDKEDRVSESHETGQSRVSDSNMMEETDNICFVCDKHIASHKWKYQLYTTATRQRKVPVADLIKQLVGEEYAVLVGERDAICSNCMNLLNVMDALTDELAKVTQVLTKLLHTKYNLTSDNNNFQVDYDDSIPDHNEPVYKCESCSFSTKYEKEFNIHIRTHSNSTPSNYQVNRSFLDELTPTIEPLQVSQNSQLNLKKVKSKSSKLTANKKKSPATGRKRGKPKFSSVKEKKKKVLFQCSVCDKLFPSEKDVLSHAKKDHGKEVAHVESEDEYADIQTLESDDDAMESNNKENLLEEENLSPTKQKLDFLDDWDDEEDLEELFSPTKKSKVEITNIKERKKSSDSKEENEYSDDKESVAKPTCLFCHAVFFSFEAVQDHIRLSHKDRSFSKGGKSSKIEDKNGDLEEFKEDSGNVSPKKLFRCNVCGIKKVSLKFIKEHVKLHKKKRALQCKFCGISCRNVTSLKVHASKCNKAASIPKKCNLCSLKFFDSKKLKTHMTKVHKTKTPLVKFKGKKLESKDKTVDSKLVTQTNSDKTKVSLSGTSSRCDECNISFDKPSRLMVHMGRHKANTCMSLGICVFCCKVFLNKEQLLLHNQIIHGTEENKEVKCFECDKVYQHPKDMKVHFMAVHFSAETESLMKQVSELNSKTDNTEKNDVYNKVFKELQDLTGEGNENEDTFLYHYNCPACDFKFKSKNEIENHIPSHGQNYCNICKSLLNAKVFMKHIENHSIESKDTKCLQCEGTFHDDVHLRFHIQQSHTKEETHKCDMCSEIFSSKAGMNDHKIIKHGQGKQKVFTCNEPECDVEFLNEKKYQLHIEYGHRQSSNCKFCDKSFKSVTKLSDHEKDHLKQAKNIYKCNICGKVLKTQQALKNHKNNHKSSNLECDVCGQTFKSFHTLREHSASHTGNQKMKYFCDICGKGFYFYDSHSRHRRLHLDPLLFQCKICRERFKTYQELLEHKESCSALTKCSECGESFTSLADLKKHDCPCLNDIEMLP